MTLRRRLRAFIFPITGLFLAWYPLYVLLADYAQGFMSIKLVGAVPSTGTTSCLNQCHAARNRVR